jgi:hypothetical protein
MKRVNQYVVDARGDLDARAEAKSGVEPEEPGGSGVSTFSGFNQPETITGICATPRPTSL